MAISSPKIVKDTDQQRNNLAFYQELTRQAGEVIDIADTGVGANADFSVSHGLGRKPQHVEVLVKEVQSNAYLTLRPGTVAWSETTISLQCNTANAALRIRVL